MAVRQYIGARYVPLYMGDWDSTKNYEPLSIVTDGNGNSYTSLRDVPAGTPLNNRDYWIITASFSGAVEVLRRDLNQAQDDIANLDGRVGTAETNITSLSGRVGTAETNITFLSGRVDDLDDRIDELEQTKKRILFVADSYGYYKTNDNLDFSQVFTNMSEIDSELLYQTSIGFKTAPNNFASLLATYTGDKTKITDIIVVGGANDIQANAQTLAAGVRDFLAQCEEFPNLENVACFGCGVVFTGSTNVLQAQTMVHEREYSRDLPLNKLPYVENSLYVLANNQLLRDNVHPNDEGIRVMAAQISNYFKGCGVQVDYGVAVKFTPISGSALASLANGIMLRRNGEVVLRGASAGILPLAGYGTTSLVFNANGSISEFDAATYDNTLIDTSGLPLWFQCAFNYTDQTRSFGVARFSFENGVLKLSFAYGTPNKTLNQFNLLNSVIPLT